MKVGDKVIGGIHQPFGFIRMTHITDSNGPIHQVVWKGGYSGWVWENELLFNLQEHRDKILSELLNI